MASNKENNNYQKAAYYCSRQERTEKEVLAKLHSWGVTQREVTYIIQQLKKDRFLDEERYVEAFIRGKCFAKKWGKRKLWATLKEKGLSQALIQQGLTAIEDNEYRQNLSHLAEKKMQSLVGVTPIQAKQKLINYLLQKGYEPDLVIPTVQEILTR